MNLTKLFKPQQELDDRIIAEKGLQAVGFVEHKILALRVELGELANEWQMFKFWKENPKSNTGGYEPCKACDEEGYMYVEWEEKENHNVMRSIECQQCGGYGEYYVGNRLLEEYVDCLHFILSIGNDGIIHRLGFSLLDDDVIDVNIMIYKNEYIINQFNEVFSFLSAYREFRGVDEERDCYEEMFLSFVGLGEMLGFTREQIEQAYYHKNEINHKRQDDGY